MAKDVLVPMISGAIERQRQRDENRKNNALLAKTMNDILSQGQPQIPTPQGASGGYGGNNWENAFHNAQDNPIAQFDAGTADLMPPSMQGTQAAIPQQRTVGSNDFLRALAANMGTERFGMVDPKAIQELATPYMTSLENAKKEVQRKGIADDYMNAQDALGKRNALMNGAIQQIVSENLATMGQNQYMADRPQPMMQDLGGSIQGVMYDPTTGTFTNAQRWDKTLTPEQEQKGQEWQLTHDETVRAAKANEAFKDRELDEKIREYDINREDANRPKYGMPVAAGGKLWQFDQNGNKIPFEIDGVQVDAPQGFETWTERDKAELGAYQDELKSIKEDIKTWRDAYNNAQTDEERQYADNMLRGTLGQDGKRTGGLYAREAVVRAAMLNKFRNPQKVSYKSAGRLMLEDGETATIVKGGEYKTKRTKSDGSQYNHAGTDYAMPEGTRILVHQDFGENFKVVRANTDPKASTYGCFVEIEGTRNGKRVKYLMAHMKQGSINVAKGQEIKAGDYLGGVGNTGHSHGNHLHLEIREWDGSKWVLQDPEKYLNDEPVSRTTSTTPPAGNGQEAPAQGTQTPPAGNGQPVTQAQPAHNEITAAMNNPALNWTPSYQRVNMPDAYTVANAPIPQYPATPTQNQTVAGFSTPAAYAAEPPNNTVSSDVSAPVVSNDVQLAPPFSSDMPVNTVNATLPIATPTTTSDDIAAVLREAGQGMPQYDLSNTDLTASLPGSGATPRPARRIDPDSGLGQYRAEGDNTPVTWRDKNGRAKRTSDGQLFTQGIYEDWKRKADAGYFKDVGVNNAEDLNKWLESVGMRPDRPSEQRGVNNLNGNTRANDNLPSEGEDENITPFNITPSNSPEKFQAPEFTDEINDTTPDATQDLLDGLNGITDSRYRRWTNALRRFYPSTAPSPQINVPNSSPRYGDISQPPARLPSYTPSRVEATPTAPQPAPQRTAVQKQAPQRTAQQRTAPAPRGGYTNYEQQRAHVDGAAKRHGVDSALIRAIIETESNWKPNARSHVGAMGLMQLMPKTAKWLGVKNAYDPAQNIEGGSKYIAQLIKQFGGNVSKALMAYNCGAGNVKKGRVPAESRRYAQKVLGIYRRIKGQR